MSSYFKIYRPLNLFFIGLSQILCAYFLDRYASFNSIFESSFFWLILGTVSCASFGYWINDYYDQKRDIINKKKTFSNKVLFSINNKHTPYIIRYSCVNLRVFIRHLVFITLFIYTFFTLSV